MINRTLDLFPGESVSRFTRMSPKALFYDDPAKYKHRVLFVEEAMATTLCMSEKGKCKPQETSRYLIWRRPRTEFWCQPTPILGRSLRYAMLRNRLSCCSAALLTETHLASWRYCLNISMRCRKLWNTEPSWCSRKAASASAPFR